MEKKRQVNLLEYKWEDGRKYYVSPVTGKPGGNSFGYSTGCKLMEKALLTQGWELTPEADIYIHYVFPHKFAPVMGKFNVFYTMWESEILPEDVHEPFHEADMIVVPSENSRLAALSSGTKKPIRIAKHGIDTEFWTFKKRTHSPGETMRFLWLGAPNIRKGYDILTLAWYQEFKRTADNVELYMKSSLFKSEGKRTLMPKFKAIMDTRSVSREELRQIYHDAHVFVFPTRGEGIGMPPLEAMCTGLPVLCPDWGAMGDYIDQRHAYPLMYDMIEAEYGCMTEVCNVDVDHLKFIMRGVFDDYNSASEKGVRAAHFVREKFNLEKMGEAITEVLEEIDVQSVLRPGR